MVFGAIFEMLGAITVGARTADTIKNGIIPSSAFQDNAGVQMLAFTCALAAAASWVMWCTRDRAHVSSTYSLISAVAGVGVATVGANKVQWGWNDGKGLGAIFAGLFIAPTVAAGFVAAIFLLIKFAVHKRRDPVPWAIWSSPLFFFIAGTVCTLSIVYKGSPNLGLSNMPGLYVAALTMGMGCSIAILSAVFFVPYVHATVIKKDHTLMWYHWFYGPLLFRRPAPEGYKTAKVPNYAVVQDDDEKTPQPLANEDNGPKAANQLGDEPTSVSSNENGAVAPKVKQLSRKELQKLGEEKLHAKLRQKRGPIGWAMRTLHEK